MILKWKGLLSETNRFPEKDVPKDSVEFLNPSSKLAPYTPVIPILILIIVSIYLKRFLIGQFHLDIKGMIIGLLLTIPFFIIHEFIHAAFLPRDCTAEIFYSPAGISIIPCTPILKSRYAVILIAPALIIGLIPLLIWTFVPITNITLSSLVFILSIGNLGGTTNDFYNLSQVIKKMPKNSFMITSGTRCYYY
ncbi:metalloprotease family protein [Clostridium sp. UBA1652]|uniref:metalloprotease family protein n=1 Tax=Clostridium sp. UBA1652 TaxID=1946348 RepID=UPI00257E3F02|nr:metalloprotease family protein [Clostridium sp. UBA1652]